jgi:lipopolysaccharide/colanic/teichoic acid biosynthesis glycosyltransferase
MKRIADVALAALLIALTAPLLAIVAILIRLDSPGPALFRQVRVGRDKLPFVICKFRTMVHRDVRHVEQKTEAVLTSERDSRITRLGRLLRRSSLDELPQLWNILRGDMTFVGPRPLLSEQLLAIPAEYEDRFAVQPGVTGLAQVRGRRGLDWLDQLKSDVEYVHSRSVALDIRIVLRTVGVVLSGSGTYSPTAKNWREYLPTGNDAAGAARK